MKAIIEIQSKRHTDEQGFGNHDIKISMPQPYVIRLDWVNEDVQPHTTHKLLFEAEDIFEAVDLLRRSSGYDESKRK